MQSLPTKLKHPKAKLPQRANPTDAGADLYLTGDVTFGEFEVKVVSAGFSLAIPKGYVGLIFPRSSSFKKGIRLANTVGVIDSGYRGDILIPLMYDIDMAEDKASKIHLESGERIAQLVIVPALMTEFVEVEELPESDGRDEGGFGSTGK